RQPAARLTWPSRPGFARTPSTTSSRQPGRGAANGTAEPVLRLSAGSRSCSGCAASCRCTEYCRGDCATSSCAPCPEVIGARGSTRARRPDRRSERFARTVKHHPAPATQQSRGTETMPKTVNYPLPEAGESLFDSEEKLFDDIKANPGEKAFVF